jgi:hypothetical protein
MFKKLYSRWLNDVFVNDVNVGYTITNKNINTIIMVKEFMRI